MQLAEQIRLKKAQELAAGDFDIVTDTGKKTIVTDWMQSYIKIYKKKNVRNMQGALNRFKDFLVENKIQ